MHFHHLNPLQKRLHVSASGVGLSLKTLREEAQKCVLVCSNCHAEVEAGVTAVPARVSDGLPAPSHESFTNPG